MNHNDLYQRWLGTNLEDADLSVELESIKGQDEEIFERFYRGRNAGRDSVGIGLAMAKYILSIQSGQIEAESEPGKGSRFIFRLYHLVV